MSSVVSADGTTIGYRETGHGPGIILLHGGMMASQNFVALGAALADSFTVIIPDRRGRGMSGPIGAGYGIATERADIAALVARTGARDVFGLSSGAIIALEAALALPEIRRVAAYEPPFSVGERDNAGWVTRFDGQIARGRLAAAMVTVIKGTGDSRLLRVLPEALVAAALGLAIRAEARRAGPDHVAIRDLIPTMHHDAALVTECSPDLARFATLEADVLLLGGSRSAAFLRRALDALARLLPRATRVDLDGVGHLAADNGGRPRWVAATLRRFFGAAG